MVVVKRKLAGAAHPADGQVTCGIHVAEENVGNGVAAFAARIPGFENRSYVLTGPRDLERAAVDEHEHDGLSRGGHGFEQFLLAVGEP